MSILQIKIEDHETKARLTFKTTSTTEVEVYDRVARRNAKVQAKYVRRTDDLYYGEELYKVVEVSLL